MRNLKRHVGKPLRNSMQIRRHGVSAVERTAKPQPVADGYAQDAEVAKHRRLPPPGLLDELRHGLVVDVEVMHRGEQADGLHTTLVEGAVEIARSIGGGRIDHGHSQEAIRIRADRCRHRRPVWRHTGHQGDLAHPVFIELLDPLPRQLHVVIRRWLEPEIGHRARDHLVGQGLGAARRVPLAQECLEKSVAEEMGVGIGNRAIARDRHRLRLRSIGPSLVSGQ